MKKILITGGSGFIGTNLCLYFVNQNKYEILSIDIIPPEEKNIPFKEVDITNLADLKKVMSEFLPDYIVHLAARTDLNGKTIDDYSANTIGTENLLKAAQEVKNLQKILITSSMLVCHIGYHPKNQFDYSPTTAYGLSKVKIEELLWNNKPVCDWAILRPTSIWGPYFGVPYCNFFMMVINHRYFHTGNEDCIRTYGYIGNTIYQIEQILFSNTYDENKKVYYLGDTIPTNIREWANEISEELGYKIKKMPYFLVKAAALIGDLLKIIGVKFPMTTFRLKNMTTNYVIDLEDTDSLAPNLPYTRKQGIIETLRWLKS